MSNESQLTGGADNRTDALLHPPTEIFAALAHPRRRTILTILTERQRPLSEHDLVAHVAACEHGKPLLEVTDEEHHEIQVSLYHCHLPKLEDLGVIERDSDGETVIANTSFDLESTGLLSVETVSDGTQSATADTLFPILANDRRRTILAVLKNHRDTCSNQRPTLTVEELAEAVADREDEHSTTDFTDEDSPRIALSLRHQHLPKIADAGLIAYDRDQATVTYEGHPALRDEWVEPVPRTALCGTGRN